MRYTLLISCVVTVAAWADVLQVPGDYIMIQSALDALETGDTVVVAAGVYPEALTAPALSFVMLGVVNPGGDPELPVIDPSPLDGATHLACLVMPFNSSAIIEDFVFRNGAEMYPRDNSNDVGGIMTSADELTLRRCTFDSTYRGLQPNSGALVVDSCTFADNVQIAVRHFASTDLYVGHSQFIGLTASGNFLKVSGNALIEHCLFRNETGGEWIWLLGHGSTIRNCEFGPAFIEELTHHMIWIPGDGSGWTIENNLFHDLISMSGPAVSYGGMSEDDACFFRGNEFRRIYAVTLGGCAVYLDGPNIIADGNSFDSCFAYSTSGSGSLSLSNVDGSVFSHNRLTGPGISRPNIRILAQSAVQFRTNSFENTGWAIEAGAYALDAESNWWGDSTGPYHEQLNPEGLGDPITGNVDFIPWLTENPFDSGEVAADPPPVLSADLRIEAHPNPFNASAMLTLSVRTPGTYSVVLFNALGQRVKEVWSGTIESEKRVVVNGERLPSGVYFVRLASERDLGTAVTKVVLLK